MLHATELLRMLESTSQFLIAQMHLDDDFRRVEAR